MHFIFDYLSTNRQVIQIWSFQEHKSLGMGCIYQYILADVGHHLGRNQYDPYFPRMKVHPEIRYIVNVKRTYTHPSKDSVIYVINVNYINITVTNNPLLVCMTSTNSASVLLTRCSTLVCSNQGEAGSKATKDDKLIF